jgi:hypothetical protein
MPNIKNKKIKNKKLKKAARWKIWNGYMPAPKDATTLTNSFLLRNISVEIYNLCAA